MEPREGQRSPKSATYPSGNLLPTTEAAPAPATTHQVPRPHHHTPTRAAPSLAQTQSTHGLWPPPRHSHRPRLGRRILSPPATLNAAPEPPPGRSRQGAATRALRWSTPVHGSLASLQVRSTLGSWKEALFWEIHESAVDPPTGPQGSWHPARTAARRGSATPLPIRSRPRAAPVGSQAGFFGCTKL